MFEPCVICEYLGQASAPGTSLVSIETTLAPLRALMPVPDVHGAIATRLCPEHVIDVYRGRIEGVTMAWRVLAQPLASR
ncbi:MAG: hypothetical protein IT302_07560 [Dehalococcoidia bacterium]|nr:hypothetical protein [Dehalococcoidia bacterium]